VPSWIVAYLPAQNIVTKKGAGENVPYWQQGDIRMYTDDRLIQRHMLRKSRKIREAVELVHSVKWFGQCLISCAAVLACLHL